MAITSREVQPKKGNLQHTLSTALIYIKYWRLMLVLLALSLAVGLAYYVFARSIYYSKSLVDFKVLDSPIAKEADVGGAQNVLKTRRLLSQLNSRYLVTRTAERLGLVQGTTDYGSIRQAFLRNHRVSLLDNNTMMIEIWPYTREVGRAWPRAMIEEYLDYQSKMRREYRESALTRYESELGEVKRKLDESLDRKVDFEKENAFTEMFIEQNQLTEVPREMVTVKHRLRLIEDLRPQVESGQFSLIDKLSLFSAFEKQQPLEVGAMLRKRVGSTPMSAAQGGRIENEVVVVPSSVTQLEKWEELEKEKRRLEEELEKAKRTYLPGHRVMVALQGEIAEVSQGMQREYTLAKERFDLEEVRLKDRLRTLEERLPEYREVSKNYDAFRQNYEILEKGELAWDKAHIELSEKIAAFEFSAEREIVELRYLGLVEIRDDPISPSKTKLVYISLALGLVLMVGVPVGMEFFNDSSHRLQEVENAAGITGIGLVPLCDRDDLENIVRSPFLDSKIPNFLLESFRIIRANIILNKMRDEAAHVIMTTSARPSEGKTTQAANLAWAFSSVGEKTLVLDTDLRRGRMHGIFKVDNSEGMTTLLTGRSTFEDVIKTTEVPGLDVIPRGPIIPGSTEILCKPKFEAIIEALKSRYDRIVLDTPPVLGLSETTSLQRVVDGVVVVIRAERTPKRDLRAAVELLLKAGAHFYGFVLNAVDLSKPSNYYNYYYYSAAYYDQYAGEEPDGQLVLPEKT